MKTLAIALNAFREARRDRAQWILLLYAVIAFLGAATGKTPFEAPPPDSFSLMIEVESADRTLGGIVARGGVVAEPIVDKPWNHRTFSVRDPNGVEIWFFEVTSAG